MLGKHEKAFYTGLKKFVDDCKPLVDSAGNIRCPCKSCRLVLWVSIKHLSDHISKYGFDPSYKTWIHHGEPDLPPPPPVIDNTRQPQMSDMTACLNDLSYIPLNNEQNEPTQGDIGETSNDPTQAKRNEFEELYASANEELTRNVRLGLAADVNRSATLVRSYSCAVILTTYNLASVVMYEREFFLMLTWKARLRRLLDVATGLKFNMRAMVLWTINDFPARSSLSGWSGQANLLSNFDVDDMLKAQSKVIDILCNLELIYPPAFFDIMIHLVIHLPLEAIFGGPIRPRWMYPFERYMKKLKNYVRNKAKPEGSIAEGYVAEEALTFSSHYFRDVTTKFNRPDRNVDCPPPTCQFQVFKSLCKSIGLRSVIRIDHQELKKVIWYVLHNSPEIDTYRAKFKIEFPNKDMKEEFPGWFGKQIRQRHVDNDPGVNESSELFALACGPSQTPISVNSCVVNGVRFVVHSRDERRTTQNSGICSPGPDGEMYYGQLEQILEFSYLSFKTVLFRVKWFDTSNKGRIQNFVIRNNITQIKANGEAFKNDQYILATQVKQCFYLEDMARRPLGWKVVEHVSHKKFLNGGVIVVEDDPDVIHVDNSSDLALSTSLNDLEIAALHIDGQSIDVDAPPDIIDVVDEDDDIIDEEDPIPHDLADSDDEDLVNLDIDDGVNVMSADVARGHGGDGGGDDRPPPYQVPTGCGGCLGNRGKGTRKPNLGGRRAGRPHTRQETRNLGLKAITDKSGPVPIRFEVNDRETLMPLGDHAAHWANYLGELVRELPLHYPSWRQMSPERKAGVVAKIGFALFSGSYVVNDQLGELFQTEINEDVGKIEEIRTMAGDSVSSVEQAPCENGVSVSFAGQTPRENGILVSSAGQAPHENGASVLSAREYDNEDMNRRLAFLIDQEIMEDRARLNVYWNVASQLTASVRRKGRYINELRRRGGPENAESFRFLERMRLKDMEKVTRLLLMLKETEMKMKEKGCFVSQLKDGVVV
ncbi:hypothetical protein Tco_0283205 [Tanacetum coccineum]